MNGRAILLIMQLLVLGHQIYTLATGNRHGIPPFFHAIIICFIMLCVILTSI